MNARPPAPKAVFGMSRKWPVFNCFGFKGMRRAYCNLWNCEELGKMGIQRTSAMALESSAERQHVHAYIDRLPADQLSAVCGLLETMLSPLDRKLAL